MCVCVLVCARVCVCAYYMLQGVSFVFTCQENSSTSQINDHLDEKQKTTCSIRLCTFDKLRRDKYILQLRCYVKKKKASNVALSAFNASPSQTSSSYIRTTFKRVEIAQQPKMNLQ